MLKQSKQELKPGMATHRDKLFLEKDKPTVQIQSNHNLEDIFKTL
jgi:hypothetical protein